MLGKYFVGKFCGGEVWIGKTLCWGKFCAGKVLWWEKICLGKFCVGESFVLGKFCVGKNLARKVSEKCRRLRQPPPGERSEISGPPSSATGPGERSEISGLGLVVVGPGFSGTGFADDDAPKKP